MKNLNNDENDNENTTQDYSHTHTSPSQNENCEKAETTNARRTSKQSRKTYCKGASKKLDEYFANEFRCDLADENGCPRILRDEEIAELVGVSSWTVRDYRVRNDIPERTARLKVWLKGMFGVAHTLYKTNKLTKEFFTESIDDIPSPAPIVTLALAATLFIGALIFFLFF